MGLGRVLSALLTTETSDAAVEALLTGLSDPTFDERHDSPFAHENVFAMTSRSLANLEDAALPHLPSIVDAMNASDPHSALNIAGTLLDIVFAFNPSTAETFDAMTPVQQSTLRAIAYSSPAWRFNGNTGELLRWFKLPSTEAALQEFCGLERKGPRRHGRDRDTRRLIYPPIAMSV